MTPEAKAENEACEMVVTEMKAFLAQHGISQPIVELLGQLEDRIKLRRLFDMPPGKKLDYLKMARNIG